MDAMENEIIVNKACDEIRGAGFKEALNNMSYVSWLPYLGLKPDHPLRGVESEDIRLAKEIFDFYKLNYPDNPFNFFIDELSNIPIIPDGNTTRLKQIVSYVRIKKISQAHKKQFEKLDRSLKGK